MGLTKATQQGYLKRALLAADWFVNSQLGEHRPHWNADRGRFLYYYYKKDGQYVPGINWTQGRAISILSEAYQITKNKKYLDSAELGARYLIALQQMDPFFPNTVGVFKEETPQGERGGILDGAQAASSFIFLYNVTGNKEYLRRAVAFCEFGQKHYSNKKGLPSMVYFYPKIEIEHDWSACIQWCSAIPFWHLYKIKKDKRYKDIIINSTNHMLEYQTSGGAFLHDHSKDIPKPNHHHGYGKGDDRLLLRNDDGLITLVLAAYRITKSDVYKNSCLRYAEWLLANAGADRPFCAFPVQANTLLDIGKEFKQDYTPFVLSKLDKHLLKLQVTTSKDKKALGGFCGEDEEGDTGIFKGNTLDYVSTRMTTYCAGTLLRLSGKGNGAIFSVNGMDKK